jgi:hypothetical protein
LENISIRIPRRKNSKKNFNPLKVSSNGILHALTAAFKQQQVHTVAVCYICT